MTVATYLGDLFFDLCDFMEHGIISTTHSSSPVQCQGQAQTQALDHRHWVNRLCTSSSVLQTLLNERQSLHVEMIDITGNRGLIQRRRGTFATTFETLAEW